MEKRLEINGISVGCEESVKSPITFEKGILSAELEATIRKLMKEKKKIDAVRELRKECKEMK